MSTNINLAIAISYYWSIVPIDFNYEPGTSYFEQSRQFPYDWVSEDIHSIYKAFRIKAGMDISYGR